MSVTRFAVRADPHLSVRNVCIFCSCWLFPFPFELYCSLMAVLPFRKEKKKKKLVYCEMNCMAYLQYF